MKLKNNGVYLLLFLLLFSSLKVFAQIDKSLCKDRSKPLIIACSIECSRFYRWALKSAARRMGYKIKIVDLMNDKMSYDLSLIDALLLPGGEDINPKFYTGTLPRDLADHITSLDYLVDYTKSGETRDPHEYNLLKNYFSQNGLNAQPLLGICRGMQMLSAANNLPLYVDLNHELGIKNRRYKIDRIYVNDENSQIAKIMKSSSFFGFKNHHQAMRYEYYLENFDRFKNIRITGTSHQNRIPEVMEFLDYPVLAVQFHPEMTFGRVRRNIFKWFVSKACEYRNENPL